MTLERIKIRHKVLELCAEDDYGTWELWWSVSGEAPEGTDDLRRDFAAVVETLVSERELVAKRRSAGGALVASPFSRKRLLAELKNASRPDPNGTYWFGTV